MSQMGRHGTCQVCAVFQEVLDRIGFLGGEGEGISCLDVDARGIVFVLFDQKQ